MKKLYLLLTLFPLSLCAQIPERVKKEIHLRVENGINPSIVLAVYEQGKSEYFVAGYANLEKKLLADENSLYEIGSISKTFTALLLAQMIEEGLLGLNDRVDKFLPDNIKLEDTHGKPVTFKHLAAHTSGLPRMPGNFKDEGFAVYGYYDRKMMLEAVEKVEIKTVGKNMSYSNFGVGLLGETLAIINNTSYQQLIKEKVLNPLQLKATFADVPGSSLHLSKGYAEQEPVDATKFKSLAGAGALYSSIKDLLKYGVYFIDSTNQSNLNQAIENTKKIHFSGNNQKIGLAWHIIQGVLFHNGQTGGYSSIILIDPKQQKVIALMTNSSTNDVEDIAFHLLNNKKSMRNLYHTQVISVDALTEYLGSFSQQQQKRPHQIILKDNSLVLKMFMQPRYVLTYQGEDKFYSKLYKAEVNFIRNDQNKISGFEFIRNQVKQLFNVLES